MMDTLKLQPGRESWDNMRYVWGYIGIGVNGWLAMIGDKLRKPLVASVPAGAESRINLQQLREPGICCSSE